MLNASRDKQNEGMPRGAGWGCVPVATPDLRYEREGAGDEGQRESNIILIVYASTAVPGMCMMGSQDGRGETTYECFQAACETDEQTLPSCDTSKLMEFCM